jgi:hypothetical protein
MIQIDPMRKAHGITARLSRNQEDKAEAEAKAKAEAKAEAEKKREITGRHPGRSPAKDGNEKA